MTPYLENLPARRSRRAFLVGSIAFTGLATLLNACSSPTPAAPTNAPTAAKPATTAVPPTSSEAPTTAPATAASTTSPAKGTGEVIYSGFGGVYEQGVRKSYVEPFQMKTGITVQVTTGAADIAKLVSMVQANRTEWDVVDATGPAFGQILSRNLAQALDYAVVDKGDVDPKLVSDFGVGTYLYSHNIFWNTKFIQGPLNSWSDVWDVQKYPGKRGFQRVPWYTLECALLADGVATDKLYPLEIDRAFKSLDKIKSNAVFQDLNSLTNLVSQGEIVTADLNLARIKQAIKDGVPLEYNWKQHIVDMERFVVLKGAPNRENAMRLVNYTLQPDAQLAVLQNLGYSPTAKAAVAQISTDQAKDLPGTPATAADGFYLDADWWAKNGDAVQKRFNDWLLA